MGEHEWKPGDVAMVTWKTHGEQRETLCMRRGEWWTPGDPTIGTLGSSAGEVKNVRPLAVIDPEDREQVARLADAFTVAEDPRDIAASSHRIDAFEIALREFADPKPPPCGASLTLGKDGAMYHCSETEGHAGPHFDGRAGCTWTAQS